MKEYRFEILPPGRRRLDMFFFLAFFLGANNVTARAVVGCALGVAVVAKLCHDLPIVFVQKNLFLYLYGRELNGDYSNRTIVRRLSTNLFFGCMILPGGGLRLQTSGGVKAQWFDSTLRTKLGETLCIGVE